MKLNLVLVSCILFLIACTDDPPNHLKHDPNYTHVYICPIDCEKGKTYEQTAKCPVCHRKLLQKEVRVKDMNQSVDSINQK